MKRKDELKLDILSNIKDEIIDAQSEKRYKLMTRKRRPKWIIPSSVAAVLLIAIMIPLFVILFSKQVPIYEGMSVLSSYTPAGTASNGSTEQLSVRDFGKPQFDFLTNDNGNHYGHDKKPVEDIVEDDASTTLTVPDQQMYYAKANQDIYINIHFSNPDDFVILSFVFNGKTYSSYMFEEGSDMENIIIKCNVGDVEGITEYTIDAIKYVDGTAIKDVVMAGDRTVKVGVYAPDKLPTAQITEEVIGINDISFTASVNDRLGLIEMSEGDVFAVICSDDAVIAQQKLTVGENNVKFEGLTKGTTYRYAIVANYDSLDGTGFSTYVLYEKQFTTKKEVAIVPAGITQDSISFTLEWEESFENKVLASLTLYRGEEKIRELDVNAAFIDGLLSNNEYRLIATYTSKGETETSDLTFTTQAKAEPSFTFKDIESEIYSINGEYDITNVDNTLISYKVELYCGDELVNENTDKEIAFDLLDYYTDYTVKITYTFDVNDGKGVQTKTAEYTIKTLPYIDVTECKIANTSAISEGDTIFMQVKLDNPLNMSVESVVVNGETYSVTGASTTNKIFVEIVYSDQFAGGDTYLKVDKVNAKIDTTTLAVAPKTELADNIFINGKLEVLKLEFVNKDLEPIDWAFPSDSVYLLITLDNPTGYTIDNIISHGGSETEEWIRIDDNQLYRSISIPSGWTTTYFESLVYHNQYVEKTLTCTGIETSCFEVTSDDTVYISTPDDLKNMYEGYYYELSGDIDLSGIEWLGKSLLGVFDGKGYSIRNMSFVGTIKNADAYLGLFYSADGLIQDVHINAATIIAEITSDNGNYYSVYCGALAGTANGAIIRRCYVDSDSIITVKNNSSENNDSGGCNDFVGGLVGVCGDGIIAECSNSGSINVTSKYCAVGGLIGNSSSETIINCINNGNASATSDYGSVGGLVGCCGLDTITNCINSGNISITGTLRYAYAGGLVGFYRQAGGGTIVNCVNDGMITGPDNDHYGGLIIPYDPKLIVINSYSRLSYGVGHNGIRCTIDQLNSKEFYTETLGWSEDIWDFSELDVENGKYPKLK